MFELNPVKMSTKVYNLKWKHFNVNQDCSLKELFINNRNADVTLVSDDKVAFHAHRLVISTCSPVLKHLLLKNIITEEDWDTWKNDITIEYSRDNYFSELKESELFKERIQTLDMINQYVGEYFTKDWVMKNILKLSEEDMKELEQKVDDENEEEARKDTADINRQNADDEDEN